MAEQKENPKVTGLMTWVRLLLPLGLAALGWYIGQTVGNLDQRLSAMEEGDRVLKEEFIEHRATADAWMREIERRITADELTIEDLVSMSQFMSRASGHDKRLERLEDRINELIKEEK